MWLVLSALRRPVTVVVAVLAIVLTSMLAMRQMKIDIFPTVGSPTIYVAQPYGGMDPAQMEGFLTYYYEYHFFYVSGIEHVESRNIQGAALMKLVFHPGTDMSQALSEVVAAVNRSRAFMPPGAVPPFIARVDPGGLPVGMLVFSSETRSLGEISDLALNRIRPMFAGLPGVSAPPPFGGNQRTVVVSLDSERMRAYRISPEEAVTALNGANAVLPSGNVREGKLMRIASTNSVVGENISELLDTPVRLGSGPTVFLRDIASISLSTDILSSYAHVNGKRAVYLNATKRSDASTLSVINEVRAAVPGFQKLVPADIKVSLEFDQSGYVSRAIQSLFNEAVLGALLTGLTVLLFLRDWRSALIVVTTIPVAILSAIVWLWAAGQTINIMTLAGLALAVGVLVDEATVEVENIHSHLARGLSRARSVLDAAQKTAQPRLLAMLCILSVFVPSFFMTGLGRQLFVPLSLAVGFAMVSSYILSTTLVPVMAVKLLKTTAHREPPLAERYGAYVRKTLGFRWLIAGVYTVASIAVIALIYPRLGTEIFPNVDFGQFQLRMMAPTGTRVEETELIALKTLGVIEEVAGKENIAITTAFIGVQPSSYPVNLIHLWTGGPQEAVMQVALKPSAPLRGEALKERLRARFQQVLPDVAFSFEAGDIVSKVMSFGSATPVEVAVQGPDVNANRAFAVKVRKNLDRIPYLRDIHFGQPLDYPTMQVAVDRERAGQYGLTVADVARSLVSATSSSRFVSPNYWRDPKTGNAFQIQVEIPQKDIASATDVRNVPVTENGALIGDIADVEYGTSAGMVERYNMQRVASITANIHDVSVGAASGAIQRAIADAGEPPRGATVAVRGQIPPLQQTLRGLSIGLALAVAIIFLLLAANFQSFRLSLAVMSTTPAVLAGALLALLLTGTTLNVQSFMGTIMAVGIAVANSILLVSFAEMARRSGMSPMDAAVEGARGRLRPILMTASAMIAGMLPIAFAIGEGAEQTAPLGRAVIGGLLLATVATLTIVPATYAIMQGRAGTRSNSLDPTDPASRFYENA